MISFDRRFSASVLLQAARGRLLLSFCLTSLSLALMPAPASADLILQVENATAQAGGTGSFDVVLSATSGSFDVSGFSVELSVDPGSGITFTGVSENTTSAPYLFTTLQTPPLTFATFPVSDFTASDSSATAPGFVTLEGPPTMTFGLEHVTFAVADQPLSGPILVSIVIGSNTQVLDVNAEILPLVTRDGSITVSTSAVPEPSTAVMVLMAAAVSLVLGRLRKR